ncbi:hypothetical protein [Alloscardovia sp. HMSC034E08]|uniref:hypothetical protein n=1 Tax=Alloscardovia sp. HMSC034E08 TaxID=1739413 RepID=UPI0008C721E5|nr:hypothetical protein [Alloscardovia sp. HMSC034E08]OFR01169.1 hypothetical protein HMPREF2909_00130 [Alloscardovia sp. HMSC034E08]
MEKVILLKSIGVSVDSDGNRVSLPPQEGGFFYALCAPDNTASADVARETVVEAFTVYTRDTSFKIELDDVVEIRSKQFTVVSPPQVWSRDGARIIGIVMRVERTADMPQLRGS